MSNKQIDGTIWVLVLLDFVATVVILLISEQGVRIFLDDLDLSHDSDILDWNLVTIK